MAVESIGTRLRKQRRRLGLTLDELAGRTGISKPYLSLIETNRVANPPSDGKLRRLEQALGFAEGELLAQAHLERTPQDVRAMLKRLMGEEKEPGHVGEGALATVVGKLAIRQGVPLLDPRTTGTDAAVGSVACPEVDDPRAFAARVGDDSMLPAFAPDDIVVFSPAAALRGGDDAHVRLASGGSTFRRIFFESDDEGTSVVRLQPRNEQHPPRFVRAGEVLEMARAVWRMQRL